jgi:LytS/YehU family sensor histidine kinase
LNNIYALAIKRSEQTPEAIAKLSGILDYVLYRCNSDYVSLEDEVEMINDYIALERLRFGERLKVTFIKQLFGSVMIAPLLFLTLIENAFKHGASQQLGQASVDISLTATAEEIVFGVSNSKSASTRPEHLRDSKIGLVNLRRQLDLLYPRAHQLDLEETPERYTARISLKRQAA